MNKKVLIVEDQFVEAHDLQLMLDRAGYEVCGIARSVAIAQEMIKKESPGLVLLDIFVKGKLTGIDLAAQLKEENIAFIFLSANSDEKILQAAKATQPYGFLVKPFREKDLLIMLEIARYRHEYSVESNWKKEKMLANKIAAIAAGPDNVEKKLSDICSVFQSCIPFDFVSAGFNTISQPVSPALSFLRIGFDEYQKIGIAELLTITHRTLPELIAFANNTYHKLIPVLTIERSNEESWRPGSLNKLFADTFQVTSTISFPVLLLNGGAFEFCFYSKKRDAYTQAHIELLSRLKKEIAGDIDGMLYPRKADPIQQGNNTTGADHSDATSVFNGIVGKSRALMDVFDLITQVAHLDTSVLILGESGTGKERIADCIHNLSPRKNKPFVKINCAALPSTLIESELFGHEKGAFTGALERRIGKFEKADKGTIFLDEIGEMPADLQVKLLRVLQEKYIERIGARDATKVDVRIIAATNRNLEKEVAEGRFRLDLYYRLNVFPIVLPALRERVEDIPVLASHFINTYNAKAGKKITGLSDKVLKNMVAYGWPGNVRELENLMERAVLLAKGTIIEDIPLQSPAKKEVVFIQDPQIKTIHENERDYIISVLKKCNGKIWGEGGAAELLNLPPSTLKSKMKKLGISKVNY